MRYQLRDLFRDVIEAAKETGIWQTMTLDEKEEVVNYFLRHFDAIEREQALAEVFSTDDGIPG